MNKYDMNTHIKKHIPMVFREKFSCDQCKFSGLSIASLKSHKKNDHNTENQRSECHCGKVFQSIQKLKSHAKYAHFSAKKHICNICSKAFMHSSALRVCIFMKKCDNLIINFIIY